MRNHPNNGRTVLVVDDERLVLGTICELMTIQGYQTLAAGDAGEALRICSQHDGPIHLLLTDVVMPGMNGRELAEQVTEMRPETRVIYMSGHTADAALHYGVRTNTITFIQKPFTVAALESKVQEAVGEGDAEILARLRKAEPLG